jgi:hypothetical protein
MVGDHERRAAGTVPFWAHQLAEMLLGGLLLIEGARTGQHTAVLVGMGGALLLLSLLSDGALGAWPWVGRRLHRVLDVVAAAALALSPLVLSLDAVLAIVVLEAAALGMVWLAVRTNWTTRRVRPRPTRASPWRPEPDPTPAPSPAPEAPLARKLGAAVGKARDDGPRQLGRMVGRTRSRLRQAGADGSGPPPPAMGESPPTPPDGA